MLLPLFLAALLAQTGLAILPGSTVSPDNTCGPNSVGHYFCPSDKPCCSSSGFCGSGDSYCLTSLGCQSDYTPAANNCYAPIDGVTITPDGTCGLTAAGHYGYHCYPKNGPIGYICCSQYGYCGNTTVHCLPNGGQGCQKKYGYCYADEGV